MHIKMDAHFDADTGDLTRFDIFVKIADNGKGACHWLFVDSFLPDSLIKTMQERAREVLNSGRAIQSSREFLAAIKKAEGGK